MKFLTKVSAGVLLSVGTVFILLTFIGATTLRDEKDKTNLLVGGLVLGLPPALIGGWLAQSLYKQQKERDRLQATFFKLIRQGDGRLTTLDFSMETGLDGKSAKAYLDERAIEFDAAFDVDENGNQYYRFSKSTVSLPPPNEVAFKQQFGSTGTFDVILESVPARSKIAAIKVVRELTSLGLKEAKDLVEATPATLKNTVSSDFAYECRAKFEAIGATVIVINNQR